MQCERLVQISFNETIQNNYISRLKWKFCLLKFIPWFRSWKKSKLGQAEDNCQSIYNPGGEISVVREADEVMEEEIVEDSDKEGDEIWSLTAII